MMPDVGWTFPSAAAAGFVAPAVTPDGVFAALPLVGAGVITVGPGAGAAIDEGAASFGVTVALGLGATVDGAAAFGLAAFAAVSAIAPADSVTVVFFFDVSLGDVCCAAAGRAIAASSMAASV
jgi:hypothetical protein